MTVDERLADWLERTTPEPPHPIAVADVAARVRSQASFVAAPARRGVRRADRGDHGRRHVALDEARFRSPGASHLATPATGQPDTAHVEDLGAIYRAPDPAMARPHRARHPDNDLSMQREQ